MTLRTGFAALLIGAILVGAGTLIERGRASAGELTGPLPVAGGVALVSWSGGATSELVSDAGAGGCRLESVWTFPNAIAVGYLVGAPAFVNAAHFEVYPAGDLPAGPVLLVCGASADGPAVYRDARFEVEVTRDVVYGQGLSHRDWGSSERSAVDLTLDVYRPIDPPSTPRPAIVLIHGGGFLSGHSRMSAYVETAEYFASRGWVAFSINYRLGGDRGTVPAGWPGSNAAYPAIRDAKAAIRWVRANAAFYHLDPSRITAQGGSAGGIAAIALGASDEGDYRDELTVADDPTLATTNLGEASGVATVVDHWGSLSALNALTAFDGRPRLDGSDAPAIVIHGTADHLVPFASGEAVRDAYRAAGIAVAFHALEDAGHGAWSTPIDGRPQNAVVLDFIAMHQSLDVR